MMAKAVLLLALVLPLEAQDWTPKKIVAIAEYPRIARLARVSGDVSVRCSLNADGSVFKAEVISGPSLLKEQAVRNALLWRFERTSATTGDNTFVLTYVYRLEGEEQSSTIAVSFIDLPNTIHVLLPRQRSLVHRRFPFSSPPLNSLCNSATPPPTTQIFKNFFTITDSQIRPAFGRGGLLL